MLLRALLDVNVPKFLNHDLPLFENIIKDLFPTVAKPVIDYGELDTSLRTTMANMKLIPAENFLFKVI